VIRRLRQVRRRFTDVPFAAIVGLLGVNNAITLLLHPGQQAASLLASPLDYVWAGMYSCGGLLILAGIGTTRANVEAAGCVAFAGGALVSALATAIVRGWSAWNAVLVLMLFAAAAGVRTYHLACGRVLVLLDVDGGRLLRDARR
jgi:hypothetical protein